VLDLREVLSDFDSAQPPEELRQRVMRDAAEVFATERRGRKSTTSAGQRRHRPVAWVAAGLAAALVLGVLVIAAHSRDAHHPPRPAQQANATVLPAGPPPRPLDTQVRYRTPSGFTPEVHLSVPAGWYGYAKARGFSVGKGLQHHFYTDGQIYVWRIDQPFAATIKAFRRLHGLTITAWKPASVGGHTGLTFAITVPGSPLPAFGGYVPDGNTRAIFLDFDNTTLMINVQPSHGQAGRAEQRRVIQSFSFPP
jgi:hypothetical protein